MSLRRLDSGCAGLGVPELVRGEVRLSSGGASWVWSDGRPYLLSPEERLRGPLSIQVTDLGGLGPGDRVEIRITGERFRSWSRPEGRIVEWEWPALADAALARDVRRLVNGDLEEVARALAGRGGGLTPTGDDVLTGYVLINGDDGGVVLDAIHARSGEPALSLARWAAGGECFAMVLQARDALVGVGDPSAIDRMAALGSETGHGMLAGMIAGLRTG